MKLTDRQFQVLEYISMFNAIKGRSPTYAEIGSAFGISSEGAHWHVMALLGRGVIGKDRYEHCSIRITPLGQEILDTARSTIAIDSESMQAWKMVGVEANK